MTPEQLITFAAVAEHGNISHAAQAGKLDILINNAALFDLAPIVDITRDSYERLFSINVAGTLFTLQAAAQGLAAQPVFIFNKMLVRHQPLQQ